MGQGHLVANGAVFVLRHFLDFTRAEAGKITFGFGAQFIGVLEPQECSRNGILNAGIYPLSKIRLSRLKFSAEKLERTEIGRRKIRQFEVERIFLENKKNGPRFLRRPVDRASSFTVPCQRRSGKDN